MLVGRVLKKYWWNGIGQCMWAMYRTMEQVCFDFDHLNKSCKVFLWWKILRNMYLCLKSCFWCITRFSVKVRLCRVIVCGNSVSFFCLFFVFASCSIYQLHDFDPTNEKRLPSVNKQPRVQLNFETEMLSCNRNFLVASKLLEWPG